MTASGGVPTERRQGKGDEGGEKDDVCQGGTLKCKTRRGRSWAGDGAVTRVGGWVRPGRAGPANESFT